MSDFIFEEVLVLFFLSRTSPSPFSLALWVWPFLVILAPCDGATVSVDGVPGRVSCIEMAGIRLVTFNLGTKVKEQ